MKWHEQDSTCASWQERGLVIWGRSAPASEAALSDVCLPIDGPANTANFATGPTFDRLDNRQHPSRISQQAAVVLNELSTSAADTTPVA